MDAFIARQPIFDSRQRVFGYELLFRSSLENVFRHSNPDQATSKVISDAFFLFHPSALTEGKRAFINLTRDILLNEYMFLIPKEKVVVEILETIDPDSEVIAACKKLKQAGYLLAMDDFIYKEQYTPLLELADFIKVDFLSTSEHERRGLVKEFAPLGIRFLAEKVETPQAFSEALEMGYRYFQGYFFCKPLVIKGKDIPGSKLHYFQVLQEIHQREMDFKRIERIIKQDVSLAYKLLRYINSSYFGVRNRINSIRQALLLLGQAEIKKWLSLITLAGMGTDKPGQLVVHTITRAKFCESLAPHAGLQRRADDLFLVGMLSLMDAFLDRPISDLLLEVPIDDEIKGAILEKGNRMGEVYDYVLSYEIGDWARLTEQQVKLGINEIFPPELYINAVKWGQEAFHG